MAARLLHRDRLDFDDGAVVEMVIWQLPAPVAGSRHRYKYRLYCGREEGYRFTTVEQLVNDFLADVAEERGS